MDVSVDLYFAQNTHTSGVCEKELNHTADPNLNGWTVFERKEEKKRVVLIFSCRDDSGLRLKVNLSVKERARCSA